MLRELFVNAAIIIASISIGNQILINEKITPVSPLKLRIFFSVMSGIFGIILMSYSIEVMPNVIMDFRNISIVLSATYCGFTASIITGIILSLFRLLFQGITYPSIIASLALLAITISSAYTTRIIKGRSRQWFVMSIYTLIFPVLAFNFLIQDNRVLFRTIIIYSLSTILASVVVYIYTHYIDLLRVSYQKYKQDSYIDPRTGLNNVRQFDNELNKLINGSQDNRIISMLFIDIDFFKKVNDVYGHLNGDKILEDLGKILLRSTSSTDIVSRNGGEEFSVIMTDCPQDKVLDVAHRIRKAVQDYKFELLDGRLINITVSIGVSIYPSTVDSIQELVEKADSALYEAKKLGRNNVVLLN